MQLCPNDSTLCLCSSCIQFDVTYTNAAFLLPFPKASDVKDLAMIVIVCEYVKGAGFVDHGERPYSPLHFPIGLVGNGWFALLAYN